MELRIRSDEYNPLLKRKEILAELSHNEKPTPSRDEARKSIAAKLSVKVDNVYIVEIQTKTGANLAICHAHIYEDLETAKRAVPAHILARHLPREQRQAKAKKEEAKPEPKAESKPVPAKTKQPTA